MRHPSTAHFWTCMIFATLLGLNILETVATSASSSYEISDPSNSERVYHQLQSQYQVLSAHFIQSVRCNTNQGMSCVEPRNDLEAIDINGSINTNGGSISDGDNESPRGGAGGTESMEVVKTASAASDAKSHEGDIYHGGPSKAHMGTDPSASSTAGQSVRANGAMAAVIVLVSGLWKSANLL
ncbi:hypothetical protein FBU30_005820 [Linnemannia zychae]|nr:hypothetical protein FBU30_005820 [Linnemannia zychae]